MFAALGLLGCLALPQDPPFAFATAFAEVEATLHRECVAAGVVGGSVLFVQGGRELGFASHGLADRAGGRAVDRDTIFHWASCTKTFTAILAMQLVARDRLRLDQPIVELVPELREVHPLAAKVEDVTLAHLLSHSGGFRAPTWPWGGDQPWHPHEPTRWSQLVAMLPYTAVEFVPGSKFAYSNPGIVFVARALEARTGDEFEVLLEKNLLRPLGMRASYCDTTPYHLQRHRSHSYEGKDAAVDLGADFDTGITVGNGGLNAPLPDLARYLTFLLGASPPDSDAAGVLPRALLEAMWVPRLPTGGQGKEHIGLGFFVQERGGTLFPTHTGGQRAFVSFFYVHPASGTAACGAFNTASAGPVMARLRTLCMESLSLRMVPR